MMLLLISVQGTAIMKGTQTQTRAGQTVVEVTTWDQLTWESLTGVTAAQQSPSKATI